MIIMALLFIIQLSVSIGAIAVSHEQQSKLMEAGWRRMTDEVKSDIQSAKDCCGFQNETSTLSDPKMRHPECSKVSTKNHLVSSLSVILKYGFCSPVLNWVCFLEEATFSPLLMRPLTKALHKLC